MNQVLEFGGRCMLITLLYLYTGDQLDYLKLTFGKIVYRVYNQVFRFVID